MMTRKLEKQTHSQQRKKGFTLTEIAIVLGIIGLILGAIWIAAASVYQNQRVAKANTEILSVAQAIRSLYATSTATGAAADNTNMTADLCKAGVFPADMFGAGACSINDVYNPWNGTSGGVQGGTSVASQSINTANAGDAFAVIMFGVPQSACISLLTQLGGSSGPQGLWYLGAVGGGGQTIAHALSGYTVGTPTTFPVSVGTAAGLCSNNNNLNSLVAIFNLKG